MKNGKMGPKKKLTTCNICNKQYKPFLDIGNWQAEGCASFTDGKLLRCCYGSKLDGDVYLIDDNIKGIICDSCVLDLIAYNGIELLKTEDYFCDFKLESE